MSIFAMYCYRPPDDNAKHKEANSIQRKQGVILVKTKLAILVGYYGETIQAGNAATTVEALADYLIQHNS